MNDFAVAPAHAAQQDAEILENRPIARDTYLLRLAAPELARTIEPGQFVMIRPNSGCDPLLGRPFALYDVARDDRRPPYAVDIVYLILGRGTAALARRPVGERLFVWGPLGHGFGPPPSAAGRIAFVAGGIGQTPFLSLARWWQGSAAYGTAPSVAPRSDLSIALYYGVRSRDLLAGVEDFQRAGVDVRIATDDGSTGYQGYVTDLFARDITSGPMPTKVVGCGPHPMLSALSRIAAQHNLDCDVSLENHMACGFGACFSCVAPIRTADGAVDLKRVCVEGPIFPVETVVF